MTPAYLLAINNIDILKKYEGSKIIQDRILSLLDRGNAMALIIAKMSKFRNLDYDESRQIIPNST